MNPCASPADFAAWVQCVLTPVLTDTVALVGQIGSVIVLVAIAWMGLRVGKTIIREFGRS